MALGGYSHLWRLRSPPLCAGHGFKLAPVVGKVLCELSLGQAPSCDTEPFRIQRFPGQRRAAL